MPLIATPVEHSLVAVIADAAPRDGPLAAVLPSWLTVAGIVAVVGHC